MGGVLAYWLKENNIGLYEQQMGRKITSRHGPITHEELCKKFNAGIRDAFEVKNECYDVSLDKWLCIYDIQNFMRHFCGYDSFDDVPVGIRSKVFRHTNGKIPQDWNEISQRDSF